jgi:hypothetical protein
VSRRAPTHAASDAQRRDRAAFIINFRLPRDDFGTPCEIFPFICARTPAHWDAEIWRARGRCAFGSGGRFHGSSAVPPSGTGNRLEIQENCVGSTGSTGFASHDARADACACACVRTYLYFLGTGGTLEIDEAGQRLSGSIRGSTVCAPLEPWNRVVSTVGSVTGVARQRNKIGGGYAASTWATSADADLGLDAGAARRNFRARIGAGAADRRQLRDLGRNGGFPPFFGASRGHVGMAALECAAETVSDQRFAGDGCQPAGLAAIGLQGTRGVGLVAEGGTPPIAPRLSPCTYAQPIFWVSNDLLNCSDQDGGKGRLTSSAKMGSGARALVQSVVEGRDGGRSNDDGRVREQRGSGSTWGMSRGSLTLWGGSSHVN